jgi:hypothetical protein
VEVTDEWKQYRMRGFMICILLQAGYILVITPKRIILAGHVAYTERKEKEQNFNGKT